MGFASWYSIALTADLFCGFIKRLLCWDDLPRKSFIGTELEVVTILAVLACFNCGKYSISLPI